MAESEGYGVDVVFDFVGIAPTVQLASRIVAPEGAIRLVGLGGHAHASARPAQISAAPPIRPPSTFSAIPV